MYLCSFDSKCFYLLIDTLFILILLSLCLPWYVLIDLLSYSISSNYYNLITWLFGVCTGVTGHTARAGGWPWGTRNSIRPPKRSNHGVSTSGSIWDQRLLLSSSSSSSSLAVVVVVCSRKRQETITFVCLFPVTVFEYIKTFHISMIITCIDTN